MVAKWKLINMRNGKESEVFSSVSDASNTGERWNRESLWVDDWVVTRVVELKAPELIPPMFDIKVAYRAIAALRQARTIIDHTTEPAVDAILAGVIADMDGELDGK